MSSNVNESDSNSTQTSAVDGLKLKISLRSDQGKEDVDAEAHSDEDAVHSQNDDDQAASTFMIKIRPDNKLRVTTTSHKGQLLTQQEINLLDAYERLKTQKQMQEKLSPTVQSSDRDKVKNFLLTKQQIGDVPLAKRETAAPGSTPSSSIAAVKALMGVQSGVGSILSPTAAMKRSAPAGAAGGEEFYTVPKRPRPDLGGDGFPGAGSTTPGGQLRSAGPNRGAGGGGYGDNNAGAPQRQTFDLFVGNIPQDATKGDLERIFHHSRFESVRLIAGKGFAFVSFADGRDAEDAIRDLNGADLLGNRIRISWAKRR